MKIVTTVHKAGFEQYGHRWIEGIKNWPEAEFVMYAEGFTTEAVLCKRVEDLPRLEAFKAKYKHYKPVSWEFDVIRFANKVYAAYDAFYNYDGIGVWIDCDCVTYKPIPDGYVRSRLPEGAYMAMFKRIGLYTETGFWIMDCSHPQHRQFMDAWLAVYESGEFKNLTAWHDCMALDITVARFEKDGRIKTASLSDGYEKFGHPMAKADIGRYIDHCKGNRKVHGISPENDHRRSDSNQ